MDRWLAAAFALLALIAAPAAVVLVVALLRGYVVDVRFRELRPDRDDEQGPP